MLAGTWYRRSYVAWVAAQGEAGSVLACGLSRLVNAVGLLVHGAAQADEFRACVLTGTGVSISRTQVFSK